MGRARRREAVRVQDRSRAQGGVRLPSTAPATAGILFALACVGLAVIVVGNAWVSDDAYITLRTVDNFVNGYGLRWNVAERVQTFTHPLWMFVVSAAYFLTREPYYTTIAVCLLTSGLTVWVLARFVASSLWMASLVLLVAALSKAFVDYSTSGLENPLTHLLLVSFVAVWLREPDAAKSLRPLSVLAGLAVLNRMDTGLLLLPALIARARRAPRRAAFRHLAVGFLPFLSWELFSLLYYGSLVPNTAYSKLGMGESPKALLMQGAHYFGATLYFDPLTIAVLAAGSATMLSRRLRWLGAGCVLYFLYVLWIGGDFMSGRYFSAPLVLSLALLASLRVTRTAWLGAVAVGALVLGLAAPSPTTSFESAGVDDYARFLQGPGIVDERLFYSRWAGLVNVFPAGGVANSPRGLSGQRMRERGGVRLEAAVGYFGFYAGPESHLYDLYGVVDPLLARLPARTDVPQRIGHYRRLSPGGYAQSLRSDRNAIEGDGIRSLYDDVRLVTRGGLFDAGRLAAIWRLNTVHGWSERNVHQDRPVYQRVSLQALRPDGGDPVSFSSAGLLIDFGRPLHPQSIDIQLSADDSHEIHLYSERRLEPWIAQIETERVDARGYRNHRIELDPSVRDLGVARMLVIPYEGDDNYSVRSVEVR